jgi:hypothetical protein
VISVRVYSWAVDGVYAVAVYKVQKASRGSALTHEQFA